MASGEKGSWLSTACWVLGMAVLLAVLTSDGTALVSGGLIGYLLAQVLRLRRQIGALQGRMEVWLQRQAGRPATPPEARAATPASQADGNDQQQPPRPMASPAAANAASATATRTAREVVSDSVTDRVQPAAPPARAPAADAPTDRPPSGPNAATRLLAWLRGGNPLARIGIVLLFFGAAFLAKYSAERGLFPIELRFAALGVGACALMWLGWRLRASRPTYAQILQGGGVAGFYLTVFAASRLFHLLPQSLALALMVAVAAAAAILAIAQDSFTLAFIGTVGGFVAPLLLATPGGDPIALFSYYAVLVVAVFAMAWFRQWRGLNLASFVLTFGVSGLFQVSAYQRSDLISTDAFLLLFFLLFFAIGLIQALRERPPAPRRLSTTLVFGLPVVAFALHANLVHHIAYALAWSALGFGAFYAAAAWGLYRLQQPPRLLCEALAALAVIFATVAVPLAFNLDVTGAIWAVEGAGGVWLGLRQQRRLTRAFGVLLQVAGGLGLLLHPGPLHEVFLLDALWHTAYSGGSASGLQTTVAAALLSLCGWLCAFWYWRDGEQGRLEPSEASLAGPAAVWGLGWWLYAGLGEISRSLADEHQLGAALLFCTLSSVLGLLLARRLRWPLPQALLGLMLCASLLLSVLLFAVAGHPSEYLGWLAWPVALAAGLFWLHTLAGDPSPSWYPRWRPRLGASWLWLLSWLTAAEGAWQVERVLDGIWPLLPWVLVPALALVACTHHLRHQPRDGARSWAEVAAPPLVLASLLWVVLVNLASPGDPRPIAYLPLLNPLDLASAFALLAVAMVWHAQGLLTGQARRWAVLAASALLWLTAALLRALHHLAGVRWDFDAMRDSFLVQTSLSVFWGLLGVTALVLAARAGKRGWWLAGAGLCLAVVVKLFVVDLAATGSFERIISFLSVGGLLLLAGYLAPLPPRHEGSPAEVES